MNRICCCWVICYSNYKTHVKCHVTHHCVTGCRGDGGHVSAKSCYKDGVVVSGTLWTRRTSWMNTTKHWQLCALWTVDNEAILHGDRQNDQRYGFSEPYHIDDTHRQTDRQSGRSQREGERKRRSRDKIRYRLIYVSLWVQVTTGTHAVDGRWLWTCIQPNRNHWRRCTGKTRRQTGRRLAQRARCHVTWRDSVPSRCGSRLRPWTSQCTRQDPSWRGTPDVVSHQLMPLLCVTSLDYRRCAADL